MTDKSWRAAILVGGMIGCVAVTRWAGADAREGAPVEAEAAAAPLGDSEPAPRLPETVVTGNVLREERAIGPNGQPEWTARRRFAETRIYVLPPWQLSLETSWRLTKPRGEQDEEEGSNTLQHGLTQELELGLPYRLQLDYEAVGETDPEANEEWHFASQSIELRYALADWGRILLNPTLFGEWKFRNAEADSYEVKLLLGDEIIPRWHGGLNLFFGQQVGDAREREVAASGAVSYAIVDERLSLGLEAEFNAEKANGEGDAPV
jgi:hypothetical protein